MYKCVGCSNFIDYFYSLDKNNEINIALHTNSKHIKVAFLSKKNMTDSFCWEHNLYEGLPNYLYFKLGESKGKFYSHTPLLMHEFSYVINLLEIGVQFVTFSIVIKVGTAPFHTWLLDVYENASTSSVSFFAAVSKIPLFSFLTRLYFINFYFFHYYWSLYSFCVSILSIFLGASGG